MKMRRFAVRKCMHFFRRFSWAKLGLMVFAGLIGNAAQAVTNDSFASASMVSGITGITNGSNAGATIELNEPTSVNCDDDGTQPVDHSIWYVWTAPVSG